MPGSAEPDRRTALRRDLRRGIVLAALAASIAIFIVVDAGSHSVSDTLYGMVVPQAFVIAGAVGAWALSSFVPVRRG